MRNERYAATYAAPAWRLSAGQKGRDTSEQRSGTPVICKGRRVTTRVEATWLDARSSCSSARRIPIGSIPRELHSDADKSSLPSSTAPGKEGAKRRHGRESSRPENIRWVRTERDRGVPTRSTRDGPALEVKYELQEGCLKHGGGRMHLLEHAHARSRPTPTRLSSKSR